jgi:hypothetical protein
VNAKSRIEYLMKTCEVTVGFERLLPISSRVVRGAERGRRQVGRGWVRWRVFPARSSMVRFSVGR